jgi:iron complex transport system substrate-binding protein
VDDNDSKSINVAMIVSLKPDLVVTSGNEHREIEGRLQGIRAPVFAYSPVDFEGIARSIMALGILSGNENPAVKLASVITENVGRLHNATDEIPTMQKPSVVWLSSLDPLETLGRGSLSHALLDAAGGRNAFIGFPASKSPVSADDIVARAPQVIVVEMEDDESFNPERFRVLPGWDTIPAVKNKRIFPVPESLLSRGGPRTTLGLLTLAKDFYPYLFP